MHKTHFFSATVFMTLVVPLMAAAQTPVPDVAAIKARGNLVMLCFPHQDSQYISVNVERGPMKKLGTAEDFKGLDVDLMAAFAKSLGVELQIRPVTVPSYDELIPALVASEGDVIASAFSITKERKRQVDFSDPYVSVDILVIAKESSSINSERDLKKLTATAIPGSSQYDLLANLGLTSGQIRLVSFARDAFSAVTEDKADFTLVDTGSEVALLKEYRKLAIAFKLPKGDSFGFAVRKGSDLQESLNAFLAEAKLSGLLKKLMNKWTPGEC